MKKIITCFALLVVAMTAGAYNLTVGTSENGTITFKVNNATVTQANEGDVVTVVVTPNTGYTVGTVTGVWYAAQAKTRGVSVSKDFTITPENDVYQFTMKAAHAEISATYSIVESETTVKVNTKETGKEGSDVENVNMVIKTPDDAASKTKSEQRTVINAATGQEETVTVTVVPVALESINIPEQTDASETAKKNVTVTVPGEVQSGNVVYQIKEIKKDAFKAPENSKTQVTKVILPETESTIPVADGAMKPDGNLLDVESPLALLDDYALMTSLKDNFEARKISAVVKAPNQYWTFSSGVDCVLPEGVTAYIVVWESEQPQIVKLAESDLLLQDGRRGIKANNGVLISSVKGNAYEIVANPGGQTSGTTPATSDADSYKGNILVPTIVATNYAAGKYLVLKNNTFHTIKSNTSKVKPCKAVLSLDKANK